VRFTRSAHLTALIADSERLAGRLAAAAVEPDSRDAARERELLASLRLDGSTIPAGTGWPAAIRTRSAPADQLEDSQRGIWLAEHAGLAAAIDDDRIGRALRSDPVAALSDLHTRLTEGLVADDRRGRWRVEERAVTDTSVGRIIYWPAKPDQIGLAMGEAAAWLLGPGAREHALVRAGWLLLHVLHVQPFDAANGRVARVAARALLADGGLDPHGVAPFDQVQEADAIGLFNEIARTTRRRDATVWLERWGELVTTALRRAVVHHADHVMVDEQAAAAWEQVPDAFTITDWREQAGTRADDGLRELLDAGLVEPVPGARGLRFVRAG
jgi:hypothetical protein